MDKKECKESDDGRIVNPLSEYKIELPTFTEELFKKEYTPLFDKNTLVRYLQYFKNNIGEIFKVFENGTIEVGISNTHQHSCEITNNRSITKEYSNNLLPNEKWVDQVGNPIPISHLPKNIILVGFPCLNIYFQPKESILSFNKPNMTVEEVISRNSKKIICAKPNTNLRKINKKLHEELIPRLQTEILLGIFPEVTQRQLETILNTYLTNISNLLSDKEILNLAILLHTGIQQNQLSDTLEQLFQYKYKQKLTSLYNSYVNNVLNAFTTYEIDYIKRVT